MSEDIGKKYCFDSCAIMDSWNRYYPPVFFPSLWTKIQDLIDSERLFISKEVEKEIIAGNDDLKPWIRSNIKCVVPFSADQINIVRSIINKYPKVAKYNKPKPNHADPFIIALAKLNKLTVVTLEGKSGDGALDPKVPNLCDEYGVDCCNMLGLFENENWKFN